MNEANFVSRVESFITGDYFLAEREIPLSAFRTTATAVTNGISFANGEVANLHLVIPQDFAEDAGKVALRLNVVPSADTADTTDIGVASAQTIFRAGAAADAAAAAAVAEDAVASSGALVREVVLDLSGRGFEPGDVVQLTVDVNGGGATELILTGAALIYGSTFRAYNDDDNGRDLGA